MRLQWERVIAACPCFFVSRQSSTHSSFSLSFPCFPCDQTGSFVGIVVAEPKGEAGFVSTSQRTLVK